MVSVESFADDFKLEVKFFGKLVNHDATFKNCAVVSITVRISVFFFDVGVGLKEFDIFVASDGEVVGGVTIASVDHASGADEFAAEAFGVVISEIRESVSQILLDKISLVGLTIEKSVLAGGKSHNNDTKNKHEEGWENEKGKEYPAGINNLNEYGNNQNNQNNPTNDLPAFFGFLVIALTSGFNVLKCHELIITYL